MRILKETHIDFLGKRNLGFAVSALVVGIGLVSLILQGGPKLGIDFAGGSQIVVRFAEMPDLNEVREAIEDAGLEGATIQEFEEGSNEVLIRTPGVREGAEIDAAVDGVTGALDELLGETGREGMDLNTVGLERLLTLLMETNPDGYDMDLELEEAEAHYRREIGKVLDLKAEAGVLTSWEPVEAADVDPEVLQVIRDSTYLGAYAVVNSESVGPQVGRDLRNQAQQAILWALVGMLAYISYRFEFKFGVAAVAALVHDVLVTLGAFSLTGREFNLTVVAAFLTIVGYSLNDTVVIFDRVRENNTVLRRMSLYDRINTSMNQTLSRTVLTSGTTLLVVLSLFLYGGPVINDFSFALLVGVIAGTYSTLFIASPIVYLWQAQDEARKR